MLCRTRRGLLKLYSIDKATKGDLSDSSLTPLEEEALGRIKERESLFFILSFSDGDFPLLSGSVQNTLLPSRHHEQQSLTLRLELRSLDAHPVAWEQTRTWPRVKSLSIKGNVT